MAENENGEEKTEEATEKKRRDARKKGQVLKSQDVAVVCSIFLTFFTLRMTAKLSYTELAACMTEFLSKAGNGLGNIETVGKESVFQGVLFNIAKTSAIAAGPVLMATFLVAIASTGIQTKFLVNFESLKFKLDKLNPMQGIKKMFSLRSVFELAKSLLKMIVLAAVVYGEIQSRMSDFARLLIMEPVQSVVYICSAIFSIVMKLAAVFVAIAAVDFLFQRRTFENDLKMTKQEVKDEYKQMEGDPKIKSKRRAIQQQLANSRMMSDVAGADVVVRNPTHYAVALKYDPETKNAPIVVAKGKDLLALRIVDTAAENDVPSVENIPLAHELYDKVDIGKEIPVELFESVAQVFIFVFNLKNKTQVVLDAIDKSNARNSPFSY